MPPKKLPFRHGAKIIVKKGNVPAIIKCAVGAKLWEVEHVDAKGKPNGIISQLKSQQMRNLIYDAEFPTEDQCSVGGNPSSTGELDTNQPNRNLDEAGRPTEFIELHMNQNDGDQSHDGTRSSTSINLPVLDEGSIIRVVPAQDLDIDLSCLGPDQSIAHVVEEESSVEEDPDEEFDKDIPFSYRQDEDDSDAFNFADFAAARGIELDQNKHKAKWDRYIMEKETLITSNWSFACKAPKKQSIGLGERVVEKRGRRRKGIIVSDERSLDNDTGPRWAVLFDGNKDPEHDISSHQLQIVKDTRIFTWKVVADSTPRAADSVRGAKTVGVAGFGFRELFEETDTVCNSSGYKYPFLMLLIHLWPGNWQVQLQTLNKAIEKANTFRTNRNSKKVVSLVSGKSHVSINAFTARNFSFASFHILTRCFPSLRKGMVDYMGHHFCGLPMPQRWKQVV